MQFYRDVRYDWIFKLFPYFANSDDKNIIIVTFQR